MGPDSQREGNGQFWGRSWPVVDHRQYPTCCQYFQPYSVGGSCQNCSGIFLSRGYGQKYCSEFIEACSFFYRRGLVSSGTLKMRDMKLRDMKMRHHVAGVEYARHENARNAILWNTACCMSVHCRAGMHESTR